MILSTRCLRQTRERRRFILLISISSLWIPEVTWEAEGGEGEPRRQHGADEAVAWPGAADGVQEAVLHKSSEPGVYWSGDPGGGRGQAGAVRTCPGHLQSTPFNLISLSLYPIGHVSTWFVSLFTGFICPLHAKIKYSYCSTFLQAIYIYKHSQPLYLSLCKTY